MIKNLKSDSMADVDRRIYDVCIIGAGAAGITLAINLAKAGVDIALCEGGDENYTEESQGMYKGTVVGDPYFQLDIARLRFLGGTTNHWAGMSRPFEKIDFERQYIGAEYEWPIGYEAINKYLTEACEILEINNDFESKEKALSKEVRKINFNWSPPVRFKQKYITNMTELKNLTLLTNANLIELSGGNRKINEITLSSINKKTIKIRAKKYIFAMGGIENSRMLLWFKARYNDKFFDVNTPIGKYWMEHPHFTIGQALVENQISDHMYYAISKDTQIDRKILGCGLRVERQTKTGVKKLVNELLCVSPTLGKKMMHMVSKDLVCGVTFRAAWEQAPDPSNHVKLSNRKDILGVPRTELHWVKNKIDRKTIEESVSIYNDWLLQNNFGRIKLDDWVADGKIYPQNDELAGYHHMGGTRMGRSSLYGVVDADCKVFGSDNLYIAGSSIFTTGGHNNPTLPIIQFSLRLRDHIKAIL